MRQAWIFFTGVTAIVLTQVGGPEAQKWAPVLGLIGQPFWIHATLSSRQWGMLALTLCYTIAWSVGIIRHWGLV